MRIFFQDKFHFMSYVIINEPKDIWLDEISKDIPYFRFARYYHKENEGTRFLGEYPQQSLASGYLDDESLGCIFRKGIYCKVTESKNFTMKEIKILTDYLDFVGLMSYMKNMLGGEWKSHYRKSQQKLSKYQKCDFNHVDGDITDPTPLRKKVATNHPDYLVGYLCVKIKKDIKNKY